MRIAMREFALFNFIVLIYCLGHSNVLAQILPDEMPCMDSMPPDTAKTLKGLKKYYCISQCMGGFGGEVNFCKSDGICPSDQGAESPGSSPMVAAAAAGLAQQKAAAQKQGAPAAKPPSGPAPPQKAAPQAATTKAPQKAAPAKKAGK